VKSEVKLIECPRDAWQGLSGQIPTATKAEYLRGLIAAGFKHIDAVSFVSPKAVPQMADSEDVADDIRAALVALAVWGDGVFCAIINALPPHGTPWVDRALLIYRLCMQPLIWLLIALLAGWLLEGALAIVRERRIPSVITGRNTR